MEPNTGRDLAASAAALAQALRAAAEAFEAATRPSLAAEARARIVAATRAARGGPGWERPGLN